MGSNCPIERPAQRRARTALLDLFTRARGDGPAAREGVAVFFSYMIGSLVQVSPAVADHGPTARSRALAGPIGRADVAVRDRIGVETILFGSDFIHVEGTYPNSRATLTKVLADVSPEHRYAICTANGARLLNLNLDVLAQTPAAQQTWSFADA